MKKLTALLLTLSVTITMLLAGCSSSSSGSTADTGSANASADTGSAATAVSEEDEENYNTGDASLDNVRNQEDIGENELLVLRPSVQSRMIWKQLSRIILSEEALPQTLLSTMFKGAMAS